MNEKSMISLHGGSSDPLRHLLGQAVADVVMGSSNGLTGSRRLMIELASLDGALIFDETKILAVGAMISTHPRAGNHAGARTTAALSALAYGAYPIKVSARRRGFELFFSSQNPWAIDVGRPLSFL